MKDYKTWYQRVMDALIEMQGKEKNGAESQNTEESQCTER